MNIGKVLRLLVYLLVAVVVGIFVAERCTFSLQSGDKVSLGAQLHLLNGDIQPLSHFAQKPLVINFWATWCPPCTKELPMLVRLAQKHEHKVHFIGAAVESSKEHVEALVAAYKMSYIIGLVDGKTVELFKAHTLPTTYVVSQTGQILWAKSGMIDENVLDNVLQKLFP